MEDLEKLPQDTQVNKPSSGTYGEKAEVDRLKQSLPSTAAGGGPGPGGPAPQTPRSGGRPIPGAADPTVAGGAPTPSTPPGVPPLLARPTDYPGRPVGTPASPTPQPGMAGAVDPAQQRLALLDALVRSPSVSEETREWATLVRQAIIGG